MLAIQDYLESIKSKVQSKKTKQSKVKEELLGIIKENIENGEPNTFKALSNSLGRKNQVYLRQLVKKHPETFRVEKVNGVSIVLPAETE